MNNLIAARKIPPVYAVLIDSPEAPPNSREVELIGNLRFAQMLALELLPFIEKARKFKADPERTVFAGSSLGGLTAVFASLHFPKQFRRVLS